MSISDVQEIQELKNCITALEAKIADLELELEYKREMYFQNEMQLAKLQLVVKATKIGLWDTEYLGDDPFNPTHTFIWSNEFRQMLGFEDENDFPNVQGSWGSRLHPEDKENVINAIGAHLSDKTGQIPLDVEYRMMKKDGTYAYFQTMGSTVRDEYGRPARVVGAQQDITERRNLLNETENKRIEAEEANKAKSTFLSTVSHEIRTPMNAIIGIAEIELMNQSHNSTVRAAFERIWASGDMLLGIINDILDLSKIEAGKLELVNGNYGVASLISDTAQLNMMRIGSKPIEFELQIDENIPAHLSGDELRVKQIMNNLLSNAFKYTEEGKVTLSITSKASENDSKKTILVIEVSDTGYGMTKEQVDKLFDEYARFNEEANRTTEGTGLGMSIANNLIRLMNGSISVESVLGEGTKFTINLPQGIIDSEVLGIEIAENLRQFRTDSKGQMRRVQVTREPMPYGNVLIVDDVDVNIYVAKGLMTPYDLTIDSAESGFEAIDKIAAGKIYDIIFMDHMMPKMDGIETTKRLRGMGYPGPIVALTANAVVGQINIFLENGFTDFISKPIDIRQLNMILNKYIRDKQTPEVIEAARKRAAEIRDRINGNGSIPTISDQAGIRLSGINIEGLNISDGLEQFGGNEETYVNILRAYAANTNRLLSTLASVNEDDIYDYEVTVHSIKGSSYGIFANALGGLAATLENAAKSRDLDYISKHNPPFIEAVRQLVCELDSLLSSLDTGDSKPKKDKPDSDLLVRLRDACDTFDMGEVDVIMEEINEFEYESDDGLAKWLRENVELVNFDEIVQRLS
ncbi:MAG: response regulator [Oscillospiraceae bacterium]|jgi:PAS domain S-box-containing protein|nr:response regulator [Oscillospiraceae bacterium]